MIDDIRRDPAFEHQLELADANPHISEKRGWPRCALPPIGWWCSREAGHHGPCATHRGDLVS